MSAKKSDSKGSEKAASDNKDASKQQHEQRELTAIYMFVIGILLVCLVFMEGTSLWRIIHNLLFGVFGIIAYIIPLIFLAMGVLLTTDRITMFSSHRSIQLFLLITIICSAVQIFIGEQPGDNGILYNLRILYVDGQNQQGGGIFGAILGWPLYYLFGRAGASIIIVLGLLVFILLVTGSTLNDFFFALRLPLDKFRAIYRGHLAERERSQEEKEKALINPHMSLVDDDEQQSKLDLPNHPVMAAKSTKPIKIVKPTKVTKPKDFGKYYDIPLEDDKASNTVVSYVNQPPIIIAGPKQEHGDTENGFDEEPTDLEMLIRKNIPKDAIIEDDDAPTLVNSVPNTFKSGESKLMSSTQEVSRINQQPASFPRKIDMPLHHDIDSHEIDENTYHYPPTSLLKDAKVVHNSNVGEELRQNADLLVDTLKSFGVHTKILDITRGPTVTRYELQPSAGVRINRITNLADDIALNLASAGVRIEAPIPNKAAVGIEVPNKTISMVKIKEILTSPKFLAAKSNLSVALGKDISGQVIVADIGSMPHVLIAGSTGSGKSVCINTIIISLLYKSSPDEVRLLMIDPKVVELGIYNGIPHLLVPVVTDPRKAAGALNWAVTEMLNRYKLFAEYQVRDIRGYNQFAASNHDIKPLPQIVIIIDELADLMMVAPNEVEDAICRLAQMARAAGMHLVIATQRPSVDVITGVIKANIPSRIAFSVSSGVDSRTILDSSGAEKLLGRGDMLFSPMGSPKPFRIQGCFVDEKEVEKVVKYVKDGFKTEYDNEIMDEIERQAVQEKGSGSQKGAQSDDADEMLPNAIECVIEAGQASTSMLQRKLKLGYGRAARIMDTMEERGIIGPAEGSKPRQVKMTKQDWYEMNMSQNESH